MIITVKAKSPGRWNVYRSEGLVTNVPAGRIVRTQSLGAVKAYYFDLEERRHDLGSLPRDWPNQVKKILKMESNHV